MLSVVVFIFFFGDCLRSSPPKSFDLTEAGIRAKQRTHDAGAVCLVAAIIFDVVMGLFPYYVGCFFIALIFGLTVYNKIESLFKKEGTKEDIDS